MYLFELGVIPFISCWGKGIERGSRIVIRIRRKVKEEYQ